MATREVQRRRIGPGAPAGRPGSAAARCWTSKRTATAETPNETASSSNAALVENTASSAPAAAKPTTCPLSLSASSNPVPSW